MMVEIVERLLLKSRKRGLEKEVVNDYNNNKKDKMALHMPLRCTEETPFYPADMRLYRLCAVVGQLLRVFMCQEQKVCL